MNYTQLIQAIVNVHERAQAGAAVAVNQFLVIRNWLVGGYIVEFEQKGLGRAQYGARLLERLSEDLTKQGLQGLSLRTLRDCRQIYRLYPQIRQTVSAEFTDNGELLSIRQTASAEMVRESKRQPKSLGPELVLRFSWSHLVEFIRLDDPWKRAFYENECLKGRWSVRQLQRQIGALLYERTGLSTNKQKVIERARTQATDHPSQVRDLIRDPYVLEFTGLAQRPDFNESELETALLDHLQNFLLELGSGFCFEARQMRVTVDNEHDYIDLVFYNRIHRFHLLLDLKVRTFKHADAGQMNFYLNYFKQRVMAPGDNPPVGIILCSDRRQTKVEFATAGMDNRLFVSRYLVALPKPEQLQALVEGDRAQLAHNEEQTLPRRPGKTRKARPAKPTKP